MPRGITITRIFAGISVGVFERNALKILQKILENQEQFLTEFHKESLQKHREKLWNIFEEIHGGEIIKKQNSKATPGEKREGTLP